MSDEVNQEVQAPGETGAESQTQEVQAPVEGQTTEPVSPEQPTVEVAPVEDPAVTPGVQPDKTVVMYNGQAVTKRLGLYDADGAQECELADGSTAFVPKSVLGA